MLTVTLDWELSGKTKTRRPFSSWYSVMPSTDAIFFGHLGREAKLGGGERDDTEYKFLPYHIRGWRAGGQGSSIK